MTHENKETVRRLYEDVFEGGVLDLADELVDAEARDHADSEDRRGPARVKEVATMLKAAFPNAHWEIQELVAEDETVVMHCVWSGTHEGNFMGIEPTGRTFADVHHAYFFRLEDGKVTEYRAVRDDMSLMRQLGVIPSPGICV